MPADPGNAPSSTVTIFSPVAAGICDGVGDYALRLAAALRHSRPVVLLAPPSADGASVSYTNGKDLWKNRHRLAPETKVLVFQYVPQLYLGRPDSGWLLLWLLWQRFHQGTTLVVTVHEYDVPWRGSARRLAAWLTVQAVMLLLGLLADTLVVTYEDNRRKLSRLFRFKKTRIAVIPAGSNIAYVGGPASNNPAKTTLTLFNQPRAMDPVLLTALAHWLQRQDGVRLQWIVRSREEWEAVWCRELHLPSHGLELHEALPEVAVSELLRSTDIFLAPLIDGVSSRRTGVAAALAHGLPVVGTDGPCTDNEFRHSGAFLLSKPGDASTFLRNLEFWMSGPDSRCQAAEAGRRLFASSLSWDRIAHRYLGLLTS